MPLFMDVHNIDEPVTDQDIEEAHARGLKARRENDVHYKTYWYNEGQGRVFCLVEAPDAESARRVHREVHGGESVESADVVAGE